MTMQARARYLLLVGAGLMGGACSAPGYLGDETPEVDDGSLGEVAVSAVLDGWTVEAFKPEPIASNSALIRADFHFTGFRGQSRKGGACLAKLVGPACADASDCGLVSNEGYNYCVRADGDTQRRCWQRPGAQSTYCSLGPRLPHTTYTTPQILAAPGEKWIAIGCLTPADNPMACAQNSPDKADSYSPVYQVPVNGEGLPL
jgi:hypothetical protein